MSPAWTTNDISGTGRTRPLTIGVISDTHGRLPAGVFEAFAGVDRILHAGDVGGEDVLLELEAIAPVTAVRGNTDYGRLRERLPAEVIAEFGGRTIVLLHGDALPNQSVGSFRASYPRVDLVVHGHTHRARIDRSADPWILNPGSAGDPRGGEPASVAILRIEPSGMHGRIVTL